MTKGAGPGVYSATYSGVSFSLLLCDHDGYCRVSVHHPTQWPRWGLARSRRLAMKAAPAQRAEPPRWRSLQTCRQRRWSWKSSVTRSLAYPECLLIAPLRSLYGNSSLEPISKNMSCGGGTMTGSTRLTFSRLLALTSRRGRESWSGRCKKMFMRRFKEDTANTRVSASNGG